MDLQGIRMKRTAFTMLEIIVVLVVIGILAVNTMPSFQRDNAAEVTVKLADHIRYTQHLAMVEDKYDPTRANWHRERWRIEMRGNGVYAIYDDSNATGTAGAPDQGEVPANPLDRSKVLDGGISGLPNITQDMALNAALTFSAPCGATNGSLILSFDHMGRPMTGSRHLAPLPYSNNTTQAGRLLTAACTITVTVAGDTPTTITIQPETGYVSWI